MQKRVRKNSDYICPKKPKLDISVNNEQEKTDTTPVPSQQYGQQKEIEIKSESVARSSVPSSTADSNNEYSGVNIADKSPVVNPSIKTDAMEFKEVFQKIIKTDEAGEEQGAVDATSGSPKKTAASIQLPDETSLHEAALISKLESESLESLSNFKLMSRDSDILIDFETNTASIESTNNHANSTAENNSGSTQTESELFAAEPSTTKEPVVTVKKPVEPLPLNPKPAEDAAAAKANPPPPPPPVTGGTTSNAPPPDAANAATEKKKQLPEQTTAKVSIGNTTISVPLLKSVKFKQIITGDVGNKSAPNIVRKVINIQGKKIKAPTIVQLSQVHLNSKTNAKIVQATLVGNKIQLPNIGFKSPTPANYLKSNLVQPSPMAVTSLPKQIFEDETVYVEKPAQPQSQQPADEGGDAKPSENQAASNLNNPNNSNSKPPARPKESNLKAIAHEEQVPKSSPSYLTQFCVIETDPTTPAKSFESSVADALPTSITVTSSADNSLPKVSASASKTSRRPIMFTKTVGSSDMVSGATTVKELCDILTSNNASSESTLSKETQQMADKAAIGKMLEENGLLNSKQIALAVQNCNRFQLKVSKSSDDLKAKRNEKAVADFVGLCNAKRQMAKLSPIVGQNTPTSEAVLLTNDKPNNAKSDESQNVLLKHLLQSTINQRSNTTCTQNMAPRKLANVRAPSLGVVSSLQAQLARPVIPPTVSVGEMKSDLKLPNKISNEKHKKNPAAERENPVVNVKNRPEMISRETSFVSTFPPKQKSNAAPPPEYESKMMSAHSTANQIMDTDVSRAVPVQTTSTSTSTSTSTINLFKIFKPKDQAKNDGRPGGEQNPSPVQNKVRSPENHHHHHPDLNAMPPKPDYDSMTLDMGSSPTVKNKLSRMDIEQNIEQRKKFKREYPKHKRQMLLNKDPQNHQKKKSRKLSKASEDFDEFIENKVVQMKQMFVLEVLEPLLSTFLGICSIYGYNDRVRNQVEYAYHNVFKEDFGKTNLKNLVDFYSVKPYGPYHNSKPNSVPSFQNKFYDEEFSTMNNQSCDKLYNFINTLKQQNLQSNPAENVSIVPSSPRHNATSQLLVNYPGVKFQKHFNLNADRLSPVVPLINPNHFGLVTRKKPNHMKRNKCAYGNIESTVILTLSSFVAKNILDILRDLETLLNTNSPLSHKLLNNNEKLSVCNMKGAYISRIKNLQKTQSTNIQNFLNGTYKCCRNCHLIVICGIIGADSNSSIKKRIMADNHFCDKFCCLQYKKKGKKYVLSRKRERCYQNNKAVNRISTNENNCCNNSNYKVVSPNCFWKPSFKGALANDDANDICMKMRVAISLNNSKDVRKCILCNQKGDSFPEGSSRLLNYDVNKWVHLNCALWSNSVYETISGGLMNLELTMQQGLDQICSYCNEYGASIKCFKMRCGHIYHLPCAIKKPCVFYKNKTIHCASHAQRIDKKNELNSIRVRRRVYIERDENRQVAAVMHHLELSNLLRIGNLTFINVGQLLPNQLEAFHTPNYIYPIGYKIIRFFWSTRKLNKRCRYICSIAETNGRPEFVIQIQEPFEPDIELRDSSPKAVWQRVLEKIVQLRKGTGLVQLFTEYFTGEDLFGLSEPSIVRILESLPGVESLTDYRFKYGRNPLLELPLALNPSGSARTEPKQRHIINWKKAHTQRTSSINLKLTLSPSSLVAGEVACPYSKQFVHSKSSQYRKMKQEWRNNVYLARSKIQGLGLYAARDLEKHTMVIEYIGQVIRTEVSELREKQYDLRNRGIYMFRLDEERVVDATLSGGLARYINHSCNPNCVTEIVDVDREYRIIIFAKRRINKGEELSYDYKFDIEDDAHKISCMCDAPNCRKWMN